MNEVRRTEFVPLYVIFVVQLFCLTGYCGGEQFRLEGTSGDHLVQPPFAEQGQVEHFGLESESCAREKPCGLSDEGKCTWLFRSLVALTQFKGKEEEQSVMGL